jgi:probable rRNA maturation factor
MSIVLASMRDRTKANQGGVGADQSHPHSDRVAVSITCQADFNAASSLDLQWLNDRVQAALIHIGRLSARPFVAANVVIVGDVQMTLLHRTHAGVDGTTDVLSFDLSTGEPGTAIEADIAVNVAEADRRATQFKHSIERELLLYCVHGLLHCAGYDDHDEPHFSAMHAEEDRILSLIGVGPTFDPHAGGTP